MLARDLVQKLSQKVPLHEAEWIVQEVFRFSKSELYLKNDKLDNEAIQVCEEIAQTRSKGYPLQYLLGKAHFFGRKFTVTTDVLIPRLETEILVSHIVEHFKNEKNLRFAELGLGSGCISISLIAELSGAQAVASEFSAAAIQIALKNAADLLGSFQKNLEIVHSKGALSGFEVFLGREPFDFIVSNPPYLSEKDEIAEDVRAHEPRSALYPENQYPNFFYTNFIQHSKQVLKKGGHAYFEIPHERADELLLLYKPNFTKAELLPDLSGRPRFLHAIA